MAVLDHVVAKVQTVLLIFVAFFLALLSAFRLIPKWQRKNDLDFEIDKNSF
jgi:hypothetical protein